MGDVFNVFIIVFVNVWNVVYVCGVVWDDEFKRNVIFVVGYKFIERNYIINLLL